MTDHESPDADTIETLRAVCEMLERHLKQTKMAYYTGVPGMTYEDMRAAGERLLTARAMLERALGRKPKKITRNAVTNIIG